MLLDTAELLLQAGHRITLVATCRSSERHSAKEADFARLARTVGAEFLQGQDLNRPEIVDRLSAAGAEVGVSVDWVNLIGPAACAAFPYGILNAHGGDLPRYRGNSPVAWAILNGESVIGLTIHQMDPYQVDAGPVALKEHFPLSDRTRIREVFDFIEAAVPRMYREAVDRLAQGTLALSPQPSDPDQVLRCYPRLASDGLIDWTKSAVYLCRLVRATSEPFEGAFTHLRGDRVTVWRARARGWATPSLAVPGQVVSRDTVSGEVAVATGEGVLVLGEIELSGGERDRPASLIRSSRERLGSQGSDPYGRG
jgi:UDP-4-amino-4-deoxy-L-arabinose formyltransferase/UDP-glucuronic acid dehydrogenase (UDP-4-keto-hexauronic acid decarboxylating)